MVAGNPQGEKRRRFASFRWLVAVLLITVIIWVAYSSTDSSFEASLKKEQSISMFAELETALSAYREDHGWYPINYGDEYEGSFVLYRQLSGDFDGDGKLDTVSAGKKAYVKNLNWSSAKAGSYWVVKKLGSRFVVCDPYGTPFRYLCDPEDEKGRKTRNASYDLWALGGGDPNTADGRSQWITNWD